MANLILSLDSEPIYSSDGPWLHPLFDLRRFLLGMDLDRSRIALYDKIVGRAGALLIAGLGIARVRTSLLSSRAEPVLRRRGIAVTAEQTTDRILCQTEELLAQVDDPDVASDLLRERVESGFALVADNLLPRATEGAHRSPARVCLNYGATLVIRGESDEAASTMLHSMLGRVPRSDGHLTLAGREMRPSGSNDLPPGVGLLCGDGLEAAPPTSVASFVSSRTRRPGSVEAAYRARSALHLVGAEELENRALRELSSADTLRVALARCLAEDNTILFLDHPFARIEAGFGHAFVSLLEALNREHGLTIVVAGAEREHFRSWPQLVVPRDW